MYRFIKKPKERPADDLLLRSPREEFEQFVGQRLRALEKVGDPAEADLVLAALEIGREQLSDKPAGLAEASGKDQSPAGENGLPVDADRGPATE